MTHVYIRHDTIERLSEQVLLNLFISAFVCVYLEQASTNSRAFDKTSETEQDTGAEMKRREVTSTGRPQRRQLPTLMDLVITTPHRMRV